MSNRVTNDLKKSELISVNTESSFSVEIHNLIKKYKPRKIIETGTHLGTGTTQIIIEGLINAGISDAEFHTIEVNPNFYELAIGNLLENDLLDYVKLHNGISIPRNLLPSPEEIEEITIKNIKELDIFVDHAEVDRAKKYHEETNFAQVEDDLLGKILKIFNYEPDFLLLDSAGHMGFIEFSYIINKLKKECVIALDDVNHVKHYETVKYIKQDDRFKIITESDEKFGFCIVEFKPDESKIEKIEISEKSLPQKIVAIALLEHIGDIIACEPVARKVRQLHPDSHLVWVVREEYEDLLKFNPFIDEVLTVKCLTEWILLRDSGIFEYYYDLHINERICPTCKIPLKKSFGRKEIDAIQYFDYGGLLEAFSQGAGLPILSERPNLYINRETKERIDKIGLPQEYILIHAQSNEKIKDWEESKWAELVEKLNKFTNIPIVEIGSESILENFPNVEFINLCGEFSIVESCEVIRRASLFIGIDSFPAHAARASNIYSLIILGEYRNFKTYNPFGKLNDDENIKILRAVEGGPENVPVDAVLFEVQKAFEYLSQNPPQRNLIYYEEHSNNQLKSKLAEKEFDLLALYLPQFHPIPENDKWWGKGFTEWTNVAKAKPLFPGHYQPHLPSELGFYDLRLDEVRELQAKLASEYGLSGFIYYHYWFNGKLLLEKPMEKLYENTNITLPYCAAWANENWTRRWDGDEQEILMQQNYGGLRDIINHYFYLLRFFNDKRYYKIDGKPVFFIYRPSKVKYLEELLSTWNYLALHSGFNGIYFIAMKTSFENLPKGFWIEKGFDNEMIFQPGYGSVQKLHNLKDVAEFGATDNLNTKAYVLDYEEAAELMSDELNESDPQIGCVTPSWDNTARRSKFGAYILHNSTPQKYNVWLKKELRRISTRKGRKLSVINAWNEWAEGNHLEPDHKFGKGYLQETLYAYASGMVYLAMNEALNK
ncbi:MAG: hypothetical protein D6830_07745, partial [Ignavibacteria bacterium]